MSIFKSFFTKKENSVSIPQPNLKPNKSFNYDHLNSEQKIAKRKEIISSPNPIDVRELMALYSVEELC